MAGGELSITVLVPFRPGKSRLTHPSRVSLAQAFCDDVVTACRAASHVGEVIVVGDHGGGLNADISNAAKDVVGPILVVLADQPALTAQVIDDVIEQASSHQCQSMVADAHGIGTTMLFAPSAQMLTPNFGQRSRAAHRQMGAVELDVSPRARRDVDDDVDLWDARRLGVGPHTSAVLAH